MTQPLAFIFIDASFPQWDCNVTMNHFTICYWQIICEEPSLRTVLPDQALGVAADAAELLVAGFLLLYRVEEGQGDAHGGHLDLWQVPSSKRTKTGFLGWWESLPSAVHPRGGHRQGYQGGG